MLIHRIFAYLCAMFVKLLKSLPILVIPILMTACDGYNKVLKSKDLNYKYEKAIGYYQAEQYVKAIPLFEELLTLWRGLNKAEKVYYYYATAYYKVADYHLAGYHYKQFTNTYPTSQHAEECAFMAALCHYKNSPKPSLDQTNTYRAMEEMQIFINRYPGSERLDTCNQLIDNLREKLEVKSYNHGKHYYKTGNYKAAAAAFKNTLREYPNSKYKEEILFLSLKASYLLAINSIEEKKEDRLEDTLDSYRKFVASFKESPYNKEVERIRMDADKELEKCKS